MIEIHTFSLKQMHVKGLLAKIAVICSGLNVLIREVNDNIEAFALTRWPLGDLNMILKM